MQVSFIFKVSLKKIKFLQPFTKRSNISLTYHQNVKASSHSQTKLMKTFRTISLFT